MCPNKTKIRMRHYVVRACVATVLRYLMQPGKLMSCHFQILSPTAGAQQRCEHMGGRNGGCRDGFSVWFRGAPLATIQ